MRWPKTWPKCRVTAQASMTTTFTVGRRERCDLAFCRYVYWIALADSTDSAHQRALAVTREMAPSPIVTTDEVLAEFLAFFSGASGPVRVRAAATVQRVLLNPAIRVIPQ